MVYVIPNGTSPDQSLTQLVNQVPALTNLLIFAIFFVVSSISFYIQDKRKGSAKLSYSLASAGLVSTLIGAILNSIDLYATEYLINLAIISVLCFIWAFLDTD